MLNFLSEFATIRWSLLFNFLWPLAVSYVLGALTMVIVAIIYDLYKSGD